MSDLRVGVLGAGRGAHVAHIFDLHPDAVTVALCEMSAAKTASARRQLANLEASYTDYARFLAHGLDVVIVANEAVAHVPFVIEALQAGKHVLSEVVACKTLSEAVALVRAVEEADTLYSLAENCCYMRPVLEMKRLFRAGEFGELMYAECEYVHDRASIWPRLALGDPDHWRNWDPATFYCTHAFGPILDITGVRPLSCVGFCTPNHLGRRMGRKADDMGLVVCHMDNGAIVKVLSGRAVRREPPLHWYSLYGTKGQAENQRGEPETLMHVYREADTASLYHRSYISAFPYALDWAEGQGGHGGADYYMVDACVRAILDKGLPPIGVYEALDMTLPGILGSRSALEGSVPLPVPDLRDQATRAQHEDDIWSPVARDPVSEAMAHGPSVHGDVNIPAQVYEMQRRAAEGPGA